MRSVVLDGFAMNPGDLSWNEIAELTALTVYDRVDYLPASVIAAIGDAEVVFTNKTPLPREVILAAPNLKYISVLATGYDVVDISAAQERGVIVTNIPSYSTMSVAQLAISLLLEMAVNVGLHNQSVHAGDWVNSKDFSYAKSPLIELSGKSMGIIGFGRIGQATAKIAEAQGMKILVHSRTEYPELSSENVTFVSLAELFSGSDVISLHCPMTPETAGIINRDSIKLMKDRVMLINTSRGGLLVEKDVKEALNSGKIASAAVDVVSAEPIRADNPLLFAKNCIFTPHIAWATKEARVRLMALTCSNLKAFLAGDPVNVVS